MFDLKEKLSLLDMEYFKARLGYENGERIGLDIGSSAVKAVQFRTDENGESLLVAAAMAQIADEGEEKENANTIAAIRECLGSITSDTHSVVCGLYGPSVIVRGFKFPPIPEEQVERAVTFEAQQVCPLDLRNSTVDYQIITPNGGQDIDTPPTETRGIVVVATNKAIHDKKSLVAGASLKCVLMDINDLALLNCYKQCEKPDPEHGIAIMDVGSRFTTISIQGNDGVPFIRSFPFAGKSIIKQIAEQNNISEDDVKKALREPDNAGFDIYLALETACRDLINAINETLRYYSVQLKGTPVERISVCGGLALNESFIELLNKSVFVEINSWNPFEKILCDSEVQGKEIAENFGPAMAVAAGLAMRSI